MVIKLKSLLVDVAAEQKGEWIDIKEWAGLDPDRAWEVTKTPGLRFCVKSLNDPDYKVARQAFVEEAQAWKAEGRTAIEMEKLTDVREGELIADRLLLGWEGFDEAYDPVAARKLLVSPDARILRSMILSAANRAGMRKVEFIKAAEKN
jgi:hypothetical protein